MDKQIIEPTNKNHRIIFTALIILLTAGVVGGSVWYVMDKTSVEQNKKINDLEKKVEENRTESKSVIKDEKTQSVVEKEVLKQGSEEARVFCLEDAKRLGSTPQVSNLVYSENAEGENLQFVSCGISGGEIGTGRNIIGKKINGTWTKVFGGTENPTKAIIDQYKIPRSIATPVDL